MTSAARPTVRVFGAGWCEDTHRTRRLLARLHVPYTYLDVDLDLEALRDALALNGGTRRTPLVTVGDAVCAEPANRELVDLLTRTGVLAVSDARARLVDHNVGDLDRVLRLAGAAVAVVGTASAPRLVRWPVRVTAAVLALTALRGWCPAYGAWDVSSIDGPLDRPGAAERDTWLGSAGDLLAWGQQ